MPRTFLVKKFKKRDGSSGIPIYKSGKEEREERRFKKHASTKFEDFKYCSEREDEGKTCGKLTQTNQGILS